MARAFPSSSHSDVSAVISSPSVVVPEDLDVGIELLEGASETIRRRTARRSAGS
jgi:hypothetical protein